MTEATEAPAIPTSRTHDLHTYRVLAPDALTKHEPRTVEHSQEHPDGNVSVGLMSEIGDGTFVNWTQCHRCKLHFQACTCAEGPQEPPSIARWRNARWERSFDGRPDLGHERQVTDRVLAQLHDRGYVIGEVPPPRIVEVQVPGPKGDPDHSLFIELFKAAAACEAPEGTQLDDVLAKFQAAYDQHTGHVFVAEQDEDVEGLPEPSELERVALAPNGVGVPIDIEPTEDDVDFARETLGEGATENEVQELAGERAGRDLKEIDVDF